MRSVGMFETKTHLTKLIKEVESGEELCITNRGKKVAFIVPVEKYYKVKFKNVFQKLCDLKKRAPLGDADMIRQLKSEGRK